MSRVVLITGVAGGIGRATAEVFHEAGWRVVGVDRGAIEAPAGVSRYIHADIADIEQSRAIFDEVTAAEGRLDALVNNAAVQVAKPLVETTPEEWDMVMASNLRSVYLGIRHAYPLLKAEGGGAIVNVSSVHAVATSANIAAYAASKGALLAMTRALAIEMARENIRVNAVLPGAVDTPMLHAGLTRGHVQGASLDELKSALAARTVMGRIGEPFEIGRAILFLADPHYSSFVTGQALVVDGGATARLSTE